MADNAEDKANRPLLDTSGHVMVRDKSTNSQRSSKKEIVPADDLANDCPAPTYEANEATGIARSGQKEIIPVDERISNIPVPIYDTDDATAIERSIKKELTPADDVVNNVPLTADGIPVIFRSLPSASPNLLFTKLHYDLRHEIYSILANQQETIEIMDRNCMTTLSIFCRVSRQAREEVLAFYYASTRTSNSLQALSWEPITREVEIERLRDFAPVFRRYLRHKRRIPPGEFFAYWNPQTTTFHLQCPLNLECWSRWYIYCKFGSIKNLRISVGPWLLCAPHHRHQRLIHFGTGGVWNDDLLLRYMGIPKQLRESGGLGYLSKLQSVELMIPSNWPFDLNFSHVSFDRPLSPGARGIQEKMIRCIGAWHNFWISVPFCWPGVCTCCILPDLSIVFCDGEGLRERMVLPGKWLGPENSMPFLQGPKYWYRKDLTLGMLFDGMRV